MVPLLATELRADGARLSALMCVLRVAESEAEVVSNLFGGAGFGPDAQLSTISYAF